MDNPSWSANTTAAVIKAQQRLYFLQVLKKNNLYERLLVAFYHSAVESILTYFLTAQYARCSTADKKALQKVIRLD